jgi:chromosome segregation ATPase
MILAAEPSFEFIRFIQILMWIIGPVLLSAMVLTIYFHYRKKKRNRLQYDDAENEFVLAAPEQFSHNKADGEFIFFDHSGLIREYKSRMLYNHARYRALRNDYAALEKRLTSPNNDQPKILSNKKKIYMKNHNDETLTVDDNAIERKELSDKLEQLTRSYQRLEEENRFLQEQISLETAGDDEKDKIMTRWKEENTRLREKITEQKYLEEVLEEKKAQIIFLQQQLEQRIKNQHRADQQNQQSKLEMQDAQDQREAIFAQLESLKNQLNEKHERADNLSTTVLQKEERLTEIQQQLKSKLDHITWLENSLSELKEQNALLNAEAADGRDEVNALKQLLEDERSRQQLTEQKLVANRQMLQKLHKELALCLNEEVQSSPIVPLRPSYIRDESAVH